ncbi:MAG: UDP-N-acetylmuramoyl-L-alanine--D-glutamate ligase [Christensenellaceae bacterium]|nr:UDP-N-acetylmuramoyl-L-alanine--D-glutamate ligase [Christensenellaceae bacterium]
MQRYSDYSGKNVMVVGMAKSGISAAKLLLKRGASVFLYDAKPKENFGENVSALLEHCTDLLGKDPSAYISSMDALVLSPGVPTRLPFIRKAYALCKDVISEIELGYRCSKGDFVAISGANGKTTTTALTGEIFKASGRHTQVLGNIGQPISEEADLTTDDGIVVAETAALQLETIKFFHPKVAALLNLTENHLDRFITMEAYCAAKLRMFENQQPDDIAVLNYDDLNCRRYAAYVKSRLLWFSTSNDVVEGAFMKDGHLIFRMDGRDTDIIDVEEIRIPGLHNLQNAMAATCIAMSQGVSPDVIRNVLKTFPGVEHRIEFVREVNNICFINDSKATTPEATIKAIDTMKRPTVLILGGYDKHLEFDSLFEHFGSIISDIVILGVTADKIAAAAQKAGYKRVHRAADFSDAVRTAYRLCPSGGNVLLSPACASWDMFDNFEQRGQVFKDIVSRF